MDEMTICNVKGLPVMTNLQNYDSTLQRILASSITLLWFYSHELYCFVPVTSLSSISATNAQTHYTLPAQHQITATS